MKRFAIFLTLILFGATVFAFPPAKVPPVTGLRTYSIAGLPSAAANQNLAVIITDGSTASDCTSGGGSTRNICISNGTTWVVAGDGTGGAGSGSVTTIELGDSQVGDADIVYLDFNASAFTVEELPDTEVNIGLDTVPSTGNATIIVTEDAVQVKYDTTDFGEGSTGLVLGASPTIATSLAIGSDPADTGAIRLDNAAGIYWEDATEGYLLHVDNTSLRTNLAFDITGSGGLILSSDGTMTQSGDNYFTFTENSDTLQFYFDGTDVGAIWSDGALNLDTAEAADSIVNITGGDASHKGDLRVLSAGGDKYINLYHDDTDATIAASAGGVNINPYAGSDILLDGTISIDAGVVTGATSITSTAFVGALTGNADTSTTATNVVITDNENTNENNVVAFVADADADGSTSIGLESDGNFYYNPSTGTVTATGFAGALTGNASTATTATNVVITDNESTAETNAVAFVADADLDGSTSIGLESDGNFTYTPSTGTVAATEFSGGGASLTSIDAATGDSATAFFDTGTIEHEYGGLEADVHDYSGLVAISGGSTAEIDSKAELEGQIADVSDFAMADGDTYSGVHIFGGATSLEIPNGTSGTTDATGEIYLDTNGDAGEFAAPVVQISTNDATVGYIFTVAALPGDAEDDYILKFDAGTDTIGWEADQSAGAPTIDTIGDATAATTINFDDTETVTLSNAQNTAGTFFLIDNTTADVGNDVYLIEGQYTDDDDANAHYLKFSDNNGAEVQFYVKQGGVIGIGEDPGDTGTAINLENASTIAWEDATELVLTHVDNTGLSLNGQFQATTLTDGTASINAGAVTGVTSITAGAAEINGTITLENDETITNAVDGTIVLTGAVQSTGNFKIGNNADGSDFTLTFDGNEHDGVLTWMEDEDYLSFADDLLVALDEKIYFGDTAVYIFSDDDGYLDLEADTGIRFNGPVTFANEGAITLPTSTNFADTAFTDMSNGGTYTNFGAAGDDTLDELFAAIDTAIGGLGGDVTSVGDCADGACLDGTDDGGSYISLYDGDSNKLTFDVANLSGDATIVFGSDTNNLTIVNGTATVDLAAGVDLNLDVDFTADGQKTTITGAGQANTLTLNESFTIGDGNTGTLTYSANSKTLTVEDDATVSQDMTSDATVQFAQIELGHASENSLTASSGVLSIEGSALAPATSATLTTPSIANDSTLTFIETDSDPDDAAVQLSASDGVLTIAAADGANNENLTIDLDATENLVNFNSGTSANFKFTPAVTLNTGGDFNDADITSVDKLEGVDNAVFLDLGGDGIAELEADTKIQLDSPDVIQYEATNNGNPEYRIGSADAEEAIIQVVYDTDAQTVDYLLIQTQTADATADEGRILFSVDEATIATIDDGGIEFGASKVISGTTAITLGGGSETVAINSSDWDIDATGSITGVSLDADGTGNTISNIADAEIKASAGIDATKIGAGGVTSTEFGYIGTLTSDVQTQITNLLAGTTAHTYIQFGSDPADAGVIRMENATAIQFEAAPAGTDINALSVDASEVVQIASSGASGVTITPNTTITGDLTVSGNDIVFGNAETISNATDGSIKLTDGTNEIAIFTTVGSAAAELTFKPATTGGNPVISTSGENDAGITFQNAEGEEILIIDSAGTDVNELKITSAADGNSPQITAQGDNTNVGIGIDAKAAGEIIIGSADAKFSLASDALDISNAGVITGATRLDIGSDPADQGVIRLENGTAIAWEDGTEATLTHTDETGLVFNLSFQAEHLISTDDADINDNLTVGDIIIDEAAGTLDFTGASSATITSSGAGAISFGDENLSTTGTLTSGKHTLTGVIDIYSANADPAAQGEFLHDSTVTGMSGGALRWYDDGSLGVRLLVDLDTDPSNDDYVVSYDADADKFYMKADQDSGGSPRWDQIEAPTTNDEIDMGAYTIELNVSDFQIGDGGGVNVVKFTGGAGGQFQLGTTGVQFTSDSDGAFTILGLGNGYDEDLTLNFDDTENEVVVSSSTGVTNIDFGAITLEVGGILMDATATPSCTFDDSGSASETTDAKIYANATDEGAGSEDVDFYIQVQVNSNLTTAMQVDADGNVIFPNHVVQMDAGLDLNEQLDVDFDAADEEVIIASTAEYNSGDSGASMVTITTSDAAVSAQMYLLNLDYSGDDGEPNADFILAQDSGGTVWVLGQDGDITTTDGDYTSTNGTISAEQITSTDDMYLDGDSTILAFGADQDITITHVADTGLNIKQAGLTTDDHPVKIVLQTGETDMAANDVLGGIYFQAPDEGTGTDAILVAAGIEAVSEGDFSASSNATKLSFKTGASETATEKMALSSAGVLTTTGNIELGHASENTLSAASGILSVEGNEVITTASAAGKLPDDSIVDADIDQDGTFTLTGAWTMGTVDATTDFTVDGLVLTADNITNDATLNIDLDGTADQDLVIKLNDNSTTWAVTFDGSEGQMVIGDGDAFDHSIKFDASNADGVFTWDENPGLFVFDHGLVIPDTASIGSASVTGAMTIAADGDVDVVNDFTAGTITSDAGVGGTTITASTGFALGDGDYIGITSNEIITFNAAGTIVASGGIFSSTGGTASLTPVAGATADFASTFTGANLYGGTYIATSDSGDAQLPEMAVGMNFCIITAGAIQVVVATHANDGYLLDGTDTAEDNSVVNTSTAGDIACFQYYTADDWLITTNGWSTE